MLEYLENFNHLHEIFPAFTCCLAFFLGALPLRKMFRTLLKIPDHPPENKFKFFSIQNFLFSLDIASGALATFLATPTGCKLIFLLLDFPTQPTAPFEVDSLMLWLAGFFAILGNCVSLGLNFQGGKGVATGLGVALILSPWAALMGAFTFLLTFFTHRIIALASIVSILSATLTHLVIHPIQVQLWVGGGMVLLILMRHEAQIDQLLEDRASQVD